MTEKQVKDAAELTLGLAFFWILFESDFTGASSGGGGPTASVFISVSQIVGLTKIPLTGATVSMKAPDGGIISGTTDLTGSVLFQNRPLGIYTVTISDAGFLTQTGQVNVQGDLTLSYTLIAQGGGGQIPTFTINTEDKNGFSVTVTNNSNATKQVILNITVISSAGGTVVKTIRSAVQTLTAGSISVMSGPWPNGPLQPGTYLASTFITDQNGNGYGNSIQTVINA